MKKRTYLQPAFTASAMLFAVTSTAVMAGPPKFLTESLAQTSTPGIMQGFAALKAPDAPLDLKTTHLIALAVSAQIPCHYCVYAQSIQARAQGATEAELKHAITTAGYMRMFSTALQGMNYDYDKFTAEVDARAAAAKQKSK